MNTFSNDGSFMEQFLKKQKVSEDKTEQQQTDQTFDAAGYYSQFAMGDPTTAAAYLSQYYAQMGIDPSTLDAATLASYNQYYMTQFYQQQMQAQQPQQQQQQQPQQQYGNQQYGNGGDNRNDRGTGGMFNKHGSTEPTKVVWAGNVHPDTTEEELKSLFSQYGYLESVKIIHNKQCAFITFSDVQSSMKAQQALNNYNHKGFPFRLGFGKQYDNPPQQQNSYQERHNSFLNARKLEDENPTRNLWLGNVHNNVNQDSLRSLFEKFGKIDGIRILPGKNCAFVNFCNMESAMAARNNLNGYNLMGMSLKINYRKEDERFNNADRGEDRGGRFGGGGGGGSGGGGDREDRGSDRFGGDRFGGDRGGDRFGGGDRGGRGGGRPFRSFRESTPLAVPPPNSAKEQQIIDRISEYVARVGPRFESYILENQPHTTIFNFLKPDQMNNDYYRWKLWTIKNPDTHSGGGSTSITNDQLTLQQQNQQQQQQQQQNQQNQQNQQFPDNFLNQNEVTEFKLIIKKLGSSNTSITECKKWIMNHLPNALEIISIITTAHQNDNLSLDTKLNILYALNDTLHNTLANREKKEVLDEFASIIKPYLPYLIYSTTTIESPENNEKVLKVLERWNEMKIYPKDTIDELRGAIQTE
ncbi:hypothetical protein DLAC_01443 [Tieghemostelium lacteum]|uniref:RNA-binding region RNP-1 domain-containing protein n=1 Tax=Tieghemostelium lacteum TaxID=361077 RepID=A0A152A5F8_TIELA|nr:hypothetical protein DLAC_01443 [Tieghemostelium lacteum]|eukprot:KYR01462.1 hypothetical protein DLAC_01443 [Tieghemostelium lacteum]